MKLNTGYRTEAFGGAGRQSIAGSQLELGFAGGADYRTGGGERRRSRASWWFQRMREIVDRACDWEPMLAPRPEQTWFPNAHRVISLAPHANGE
jgi:hypothetical protein